MIFKNKKKYFKKYPIYLITLGIVLITLFIYRIGTTDISTTELTLYVAIILLTIFSKKS
ncbi:Uncharacterised protein [Clostridium tertium]|uniref:Uncharacterized protein n=1 Tax=Clostridium tertium TaxID=1559 RepID=A0A6N3DMK6_9CLOT